MAVIHQNPEIPPFNKVAASRIAVQMAGKGGQGPANFLGRQTQTQAGGGGRQDIGHIVLGLAVPGHREFGQGNNHHPFRPPGRHYLAPLEEDPFSPFTEVAAQKDVILLEAKINKAAAGPGGQGSHQGIVGIEDGTALRVDRL